MILIKELGIDSRTFTSVGNITYLPSSDSEVEVISTHCNQLQSNFKISCSDIDRRLPRIFWLPKLHKNPYKFRFIAGARNCTTKKLSKLLNLGLSCVRDNFQPTVEPFVEIVASIISGALNQPWSFLIKSME